MSHPQEKQISLPPWATANQQKAQPLPTPVAPAPAQQQWHYSAPPVPNTNAAPASAPAPAASAPLPQPHQDYASYYQHQYPAQQQQQQQRQSHDQQAYYNQYYQQQQYNNNNPPPPGMEGPPGVSQPAAVQPNYNYDYNQYGHYQQPAYSNAPAQHNYPYHHQQQQPQYSYYSQPQQQAHQPMRPQQQQAPPPWSRQPVQPQAPLPPPIDQYPTNLPTPTSRGVINVPMPPPVQPQQQRPAPPPPQALQPAQNIKSEEERANEQAAMSVESWPLSLQNYVQDVFANVVADRRQQAETQLRNLILEAHNAGTLMTTDWSEVDLPSACKPQGKKKKKKAKKLAALQNRNGNNNEQQQPKNQGMVVNPEDEQKRLRRLRRFEEDAAQFRADNVSTPLQAMHLDGDFNNYTVVGTSTKLEKQYLRLTSAPDPATVRPLHILKQTLELLKEKWNNEQNYTYICDQFKSMRQDLTVQRIKNEFTVEVYEKHARIALEKSDLGEYNQCQTQLKGLYKSGINGNVMEFTAYRILYFLHTQNWADVNSTMADLTAEQKENECVQHALKVRSSLANANFHKFFKLYKSAPNMGAYLMDHFVERERVQSLIILCKACRPDLPLSFIEKELGFDSREELFKFLADQKAMTLKADSEELLDTRAALTGLTESLKKYKKIDIKGQL